MANIDFEIHNKYNKKQKQKTELIKIVFSSVKGLDRESQEILGNHIFLITGDIMAEKNYTYIVKCSDGSLYTGWTTDLKKRIKAHNSGKGAKYTKNRRPVTLVYYEEFPTKEEAMKREYAIKQMKREEKKSLIWDVDF